MDPEREVAKFCVIPELLTIPAPLIVNMKPLPAVIVKASAPGLNTMPLTSVLAERKTSVILEDANVAVSAGPFGTTLPVQLVSTLIPTKFQSPIEVSSSQVAISTNLDSI